MGIGEWSAVAVVVLAAGLWIYAKRGGMRPDQAAELARQPGTFVLDVRTDGEYAQGHLERAVLIPIEALSSRVGELPQDENTPIVVYCARGSRSAMAAGILQSKGYRHVHDLVGGIAAWQAAGLPVVK